MEREEDAIDAVNDTVAVVCYQLKNGEKRYRTYRVSQKALEAFAEVYETTEYKKIAYPLITKEKLEKERMTWSDGVTSTVMKLSEEEKNEFLLSYKNDVDAMEMADLRAGYPVGIVHVKFYDGEEELAEWAKKLIPEELAVQPVFCPANTSVRAEVEVEDEETSSVMFVECYGSDK